MPYMASEHHHDPVSAVSEAEATGRTAEIFAEIRTSAEIPERSRRFARYAG